jgi:O-antigen/teichoic acid export membrane protein
MATAATETPQSGQRTLARTVAGNTFANVTRLAVTSLVSIFLPAYLTHHLPVKTYGAWVLILQLSAYVGYLDFGVQTAVSKYIAEHQAKRDAAGSAACASGGLAIMLVASALGALLTCILVWRVPVIFRTMPASYYHDVRLSVLFVGVSLSVTLATSVFVAIFLGLQRYRVPMVTTIVSRLAFGVVICATAAAHSSLADMGAAAASVNILNALLQVGVWRQSASHISVSLRLIDIPLLKRMLQYCAVLTVWSVCAMFISGLDLTIVGHYSFGETAYYAIANAPTAFLITIVAALMGPLLPAASAQSVRCSPAQMGTFLLQATRYSSIVLLLTGLPFLVVGFLILRAWVGPVYALHSTPFLRVLILANIIRSSCAPYSTMVIATGLSRDRRHRERSQQHMAGTTSGRIGRGARHPVWRNRRRGYPLCRQHALHPIKHSHLAYRIVSHRDAASGGPNHPLSPVLMARHTYRHVARCTRRVLRMHCYHPFPGLVRGHESG